MQSGDAMPNRHAGITPNAPHFWFRRLRNILWMPSFANTETAEYPIEGDLPELEFKIIPEVYELPVKNFSHQCLPTDTP